MANITRAQDYAALDRTHHKTEAGSKDRAAQEPARASVRAAHERYREGYILAASEKGKLDRLFERYVILDQPVNLVNSVNLAEGWERPSEAQTPFII